jgi:hypothetical protein
MEGERVRHQADSLQTENVYVYWALALCWLETLAR